LIGREYGQLGVRNRDDSFPALLQLHPSRGDFYLEASVTRTYLKRLAGMQAKGLPQRLGHDYSARGIDGSFHGMQNGTEMAVPQPSIFGTALPAPTLGERAASSPYQTAIGQPPSFMHGDSRRQWMQPA
jgi:hypothetical protein